jgi:hypothetical protein
MKFSIFALASIVISADALLTNPAGQQAQKAVTDINKK